MQISKKIVNGPKSNN